jgi:hypothetical protein
MNSLVPYLDLFGRLNDGELARLACIEERVVTELRKQVEEIDRALERYVDLLPRLTDGELNRLTGASGKTIRFWRLCHSRPAAEPGSTRPSPRPGAAATPRSHSAGGEATPGVPTHTPLSRTPAPVDPESPPLDPAPRPQPEEAPPFAGLEADAAQADDTDLEFALIDDEEQAVTQPQAHTPQSTVGEDEDDLAFELSDDDFF